MYRPWQPYNNCCCLTCSTNWRNNYFHSALWQTTLLFLTVPVIQLVYQQYYLLPSSQLIGCGQPRHFLATIDHSRCFLDYQSCILINNKVCMLMDGIIIIELYMYPGVVHNCLFHTFKNLKLNINHSYKEK